MTREFIIQAALSTQAHEISRLLHAQLREHAISVSENEIRQAVDGIFEVPTRGALLVAHRHDKIVGVACLSYIWTIEHAGKSAWLEEIFVLPEFRGKGIGSELLEAALAQARAESCDAVDLEVEADHQRVEALYLRYGFRRHTRTRWVKSL